MKIWGTVWTMMILLTSSWAFAQDRGEFLLNHDDPRLEYADLWSLLNGSVPTSTSGQITQRELEHHLQRILESREQPVGDQLRIMAMDVSGGPWNYQEDGLFDFQSGIDYYLAGFFGVGDDEGREWIQGFHQRPDTLAFPLEVGLFGLWYSKVVFGFHHDPFYILDTRDFHTTVFTTPYELDSMLPYEGVMSFSGEHWNVQVGRENFSLGNAQRSDLLLSDAAGFHDHVSLNTWWDGFKFSFVWLNMDNYPWRIDAGDDDSSTDDDFYRTHTAGNYTFYLPDYSGVRRLDAVGQSPLESLSSQEGYKFFLAHRFEFRPADWLEIIFTESFLFQDQAFQPRYLNPLGIFHNYYLDGNADINVQLELNLVPLPGLLLYYQGLIDQLGIGINRRDTSSQQYPGALGQLAGFRYVLPLDSGFLQIRGEGAYTDPYAYIDRSGINHYQSQRFVSNIYGGLHILYDQPLGFFMGPDARMLWAAVQYDLPDVFGIGVEYEFREKGQNTIHTPWSDDPGEALKTTPSGPNPIRNHIIGVSGNYQVSDLTWGIVDEVGAGFNWIYTENFGHTAGDNRIDNQISVYFKGNY